MSKGLLLESHPLYLGAYNGALSQADVRRIVEGADLVLDIGGVVYCDADTGAFSAEIESSKVIAVWPDYVEIGSLAQTGGRGDATYGPVHIKDVLEALPRQAPKFKPPEFSAARRRRSPRSRRPNSRRKSGWRRNSVTRRRARSTNRSRCGCAGLSTQRLSGARSTAWWRATKRCARRTA